MKTLHVVAALLIAATPAAAQSIGEKTGVNSVLGISPSTQDFVTEAAVSDIFEIQSSELVLQRGDEPTKAFATQMIAAHQKTTQELKGLLVSANVQVTAPAVLDSSHQGKLDDLKKLQGSEFIDQYQEDQVDAHKAAVSLFERYAKEGDNPALKDWASKTLPELKHHLEMAQKLAD
ncbi:DUF4142 domain-containing protein [Ancylobacter dichloromethanicus]|uniref:DUF4142 domain-containing protein n=1 Tax=Ancylobacter dichloromethanicus TaxID=518825 RepID=A0A9W6JFB7_9HYPH|nr:DUF4142 domain-containing protein [Ancylobacter dichloromethanicus]MBS7552897.1 DUF4142 domain-containing protein [Ancylobacter dichloromethanicus]GLK74498.1 hypothetical protein GCM10017643_46160 [Ancylobacter dichloromethanicus]